MSSMVIAVIMVASGFAVVVRGFEAGISSLSGALSVAFLSGIGICGTGIYGLARGVARRARANARERAFRASLGSSFGASYTRGGDLEDPFLWGDADFGDDGSRGVPVARTEVRAAARALLVSLEDEARRSDLSAVSARRSSRIACRRVRSRAAAQSALKHRRGRVRARLSATPS